MRAPPEFLLSYVAAVSFGASDRETSGGRRRGSLFLAAPGWGGRSRGQGTAPYSMGLAQEQLPCLLSCPSEVRLPRAFPAEKAIRSRGHVYFIKVFYPAFARQTNKT